MGIKKKTQGKLMEISQTLIDKLYEDQGLTDEVLELQVKLNTMRAKTDISDKSRAIDEDGYVQ